MNKERVDLELPDLSSFQPRKARVEINQEEVREVAEKAGFQTRHAPNANKERDSGSQYVTAFDARSLRRSNRTAKLNIATSPETRERFWLIAQKHGILNGEDVLTAMMDTFEKYSKTK
jgi:hypothetical protein